MSPATRETAYRFGLRAEGLCAWWLRLQGYRILARRFRVGVGEIDIVARRSRVVAFVEVKARREAGGEEDLTRRQRARIVRAAEAFLAPRPELSGLDVRFDVMLVRPWGLPRHIADAWRP